ncbi:MAG: ribonuclease HII [Patescibacteria group bacterium]|mgnify:CR=1 FL=1
MKNKDKNKFQYIVGIDEVGRGPLAGPVAVGACLISALKIKSLQAKGFFKGIKDSKKLSEKSREEWLEKIEELKTKGDLDYSVSFVSNKIIDKKGISHCLRLAIENSLKKLKAEPLKTMILLDGGLKAPEEFIYQKTIIKGDEKEPIISLASIAAKVARDRKMVGYSKKFPQYGFEIHKGYGTLLHRQRIKKYGLSELHRKSFCKNIT